MIKKHVQLQARAEAAFRKLDLESMAHNLGKFEEYVQGMEA